MTRTPIGKPARARCVECEQRLTRTKQRRGLCDRCRLRALTSAPAPMLALLREIQARLTDAAPASFALDRESADLSMSKIQRFEFLESGNADLNKER